MIEGWSDELCGNFTEGGEENCPTKDNYLSKADFCKWIDGKCVGGDVGNDPTTPTDGNFESYYYDLYLGEGETSSESESDESETPTVPLRDYPRSPYFSLLTRSGDPPHRRIIQRNPNPPPRYVGTKRDTPLESPRAAISSRSLASGTALSTASSLATVPTSEEKQELSRRRRKRKSRVFRPDKVLDKSKSKSIKEEKGKSKKLKSPPTLSKIINLLIPYIFVAFIIIYFIYFFKVREIKSKIKSFSTLYTTRY